MAQSGVPSGHTDGDARGAATGVLVLLAAASVLGFAPILVKASDLGPQAIAFWRLSLALPALALLYWIELKRAAKTPKPEQAVDQQRNGWRAIVLAGVFFAGDLAFWHAGIKITTAANATLLANLTPILVTLAAWILFKEQITHSFLAAGALALGGAIMLAAANVQFAPERLPGDALSALTSVWYTAYLLAVRWARQSGVATLKLMFWSTAVASPIALMVTLGFGEQLLPATAAGWLVLLALGVIVHIGGQGGIAYGLGLTPAALASLIILIQPVVAAAAGWVLFGEALVPIQWVGAGLVLAGVYAAQRFRPAASTPPATRDKP